MPCRAAVVIPAYNAARELPRAVASVRTSAARAADYGIDLALDLVIVDDASPDGAAETAEGLLADLPGGISGTVVRHAHNLGAGPARDSGVAATDAELIFFLDADDEYLPSHIPECLSTLLSDPGLGYVWTRRVWEIPIHDSWSTLLDRSTVMNLCIRRDWHLRAGGFPRHPDFRDHGYEDSFYRRVLFKLVPGMFIDEPTVRFHIRPGSTQDCMADKITRPHAESYREPSDRMPTDAMIAEFETRIAAAAALRAEIVASGG
ncbi:putative Glycosyl transferase, family 2 [uncultured Alphaproteobacteria bacterium]|uniref:Putative Glycosyl transferase, family 2 n=1 Tax=uncultured Alphaproteobacteria bacterium TaxID=91750 RepID=A0A212JHL9_9PROT|nr:putative Glycosyl transferase, family 2 [uncultured Alphaproteobacteria bacterium]